MKENYSASVGCILEEVSPHFLAAYTLSRCESLQFGHFSLQVPARTRLHQVHRPFTRGLDLLIVLGCAQERY